MAASVSEGSSEVKREWARMQARRGEVQGIKWSGVMGVVEVACGNEVSGKEWSGQTRSCLVWSLEAGEELPDPDSTWSA